MQIKSIELKDFKGLSGSFDLDAHNLLQGPNGSGKSAVLEAIRFAVEGAVSIGATAEAVAKFSGAGGCAVSVTLDTGFAWTRRLMIDHRKGKLSTEIEIHGRGVLPIKDAETILAETVGHFAPMFELGAFLGLSDDKRRDFVLDLCAKASGAKANPIQIMERIAWEYFAIKLGNEVTALHHKNGAKLADVALELSKADQAALEEVRKRLLPAIKGAAPEAVASALATAKEIANASKRQKDEAQAAGRQIADRRASMRVPAESVAALKGKIDRLQKDRGDIREQIGSQDGRAKARASIVQQTENLRRAQSKAFDGIAEIEGLIAADNAANPDAMEAEAKRLAAEPASESYAQQVEHCERLRAETGAAVAELHRRLEQAKSSPGDTNWKHADGLCAQLSPHVMPSGVTILGQLHAFCSQHAGGPDAEAVAALERMLNEAVNANRSATDELSHIRTIVSQASNREREIARLVKALSDIRRDRQRRLDTIEQHRSDIARADAAIVDKERELNELDSAGGHVPIEQLQLQAESIANEILKLQSDVQLKEGFAALEAELANTGIKAAEQEALHLVAKDVAEACRVLREELMVELIDPLLVPMDRVLIGVYGDLVNAYGRLENDRGKAVFELGIERDNKRLPFEALSGGERSIVGAALAASLVSLADPPLKLLLIEAGEIDASNMGSLLSALEGVGMQVIVSHWLPVVHSESWTGLHLPLEAAA